MQEPIIVFEDFGFQYRAQKEPTLSHINLTIRRGEKVLIVGPSGSGKSTLANCINGLIPFNYAGEMSGSLKIKGRETRDESVFALSQIVGTVLQDPDGQFVGLTAGEDIAFSLENSCVSQNEMIRRVKAAASTVGIDRHLDASPHDLSGGQKQRVSMAGVLVDHVEVLLFDEPLANLDPASGKKTISLVDDIMQQTAATVLIIEHRLEDALYRYVDRILLINDGKILADMAPDDLMGTSLLRENGIREPLYVTALKYAGIPVTPQKKAGRADTLTLSKADQAAMRTWYQSTPGEPRPVYEESLLSVENLSFSYVHGTPVLRDVSFSVGEGEITAIVGTNGAGKSTLAKLICGFETENSGRIVLRGKDLAGESITERAEHIGYVMQNPNQMISKTMIWDEVALGLLARGLQQEACRDRIEQTLKLCGLYPFRNWPISALSFGQKKRVTIASVLVLQPNIIILDEPTAGQDFRHYTEIMEFLKGLVSTGVSVLIITHDMHLMLEYAPRALVFSQGQLLADTSAVAVLDGSALTEKASLKETSLYALAQMCGIPSGGDFVQRFIDYDRKARENG